MIDNCNRKINYLRISVTDRCNFRCKYCIPESGILLKSHQDILRIEEITEIVQYAAMLGITKVRLTGGEPLVRKGIVQLIRNIALIREIKDIALTTNGVLLRQNSAELKEAGLKRVNISINSLEEKKYSEITRGGNLHEVLGGITAANLTGLKPVKLNVVLINGFNDTEIEDFIQLTVENELDVRFIELMPIGEASFWSKEHFISNKIIIDSFPELIPITADNDESVATYYRLPGAKGRVGLINPISHHFCGNCNRIRLTADGKLKPCLHSDREVDIRSILRNPDGKEESQRVIDILKTTIENKPAGHGINCEGYQPVTRNMNQIGG